MKNNSVFVIQPYIWNGIWAFDDPAVGLHREPFVGDMNRIISRATASIQNAGKGCCILFSSRPFPGHTVALFRRGESFGGTDYDCPQYELTGWLCPALFKYFTKAPEAIYAKAMPILSKID